DVEQRPRVGVQALARAQAAVAAVPGQRPEVHRHPRAVGGTLAPMRAVLQRVKQASVTVDGRVTGEIGGGPLVLLGVGQGDSEKDVDWMADKVSGLRIFQDEAGKMNRSLLDTSKSLLAVSQFTLYADTRKGRRPSFTEAAAPEEAKRLYALYC